MRPGRSGASVAGPQSGTPSTQKARAQPARASAAPPAALCWTHQAWRTEAVLSVGGWGGWGRGALRGDRLGCREATLPHHAPTVGSPPTRKPLPPHTHTHSHLPGQGCGRRSATGGGLPEGPGMGWRNETRRGQSLWWGPLSVTPPLPPTQWSGIWCQGPGTAQESWCVRGAGTWPRAGPGEEGASWAHSGGRSEDTGEGGTDEAQGDQESLSRDLPTTHQRCGVSLEIFLSPLSVPRPPAYLPPNPHFRSYT